MTVSNREGGNLFKNRLGAGSLLQSMTFVATDNLPISFDMPPLLFLNPAGAIDILMPAVTAADIGKFFLIVNLSANAITLKTSADAAFTAAIVIASTQMALVVCTGSATAALGWRAMTAAGTQTSP